MLRLCLPVVLLASATAVAFDGAFKPLGGVWDLEGGPIVYVLDPAGSADLPDDDAELEALRDSFRAWACIEGTSLRFEEGAEPGPRRVATDDGKNTLFWDETGNECLMGPGTLGITVGDVGGTRTSADICFNGFNHTWGIGKDTDVQSIAMHEIGHMIGLDHPCDNDADTASCLPVSQAIMFPSWSGGAERQLLESDIAGAVGLYPSTGDDAGCEGPFRAGERCSCNDDCVEGLVCAPDVEGELRCSNTCSAQNRNCGGGSACVLDVPVDGGDPVGLCVRVAPPALPPGAICSTSTDCVSGTCAAVISLGASICQSPCDGDGDCAGGSCFEGFCLGGFESEVCPDTGGGCACAATDDGAGVGVGVGVASVVLRALRRRRRIR